MAKRKRCKRIIVMSDSEDSSDDDNLHQSHPRKKPIPKFPGLEEECGFNTQISLDERDLSALIPTAIIDLDNEIDSFNDFIVISDDDNDTRAGETSTRKRIRTDTGSRETSMQLESPMVISDSDEDQYNITPGTAVTEPTDCMERSTAEERRPQCNIHGCFLEEITSPTSIYRTYFQETKEDLTARLYELYNGTVFKNKLPETLRITWNKRLRSTSGQCISGMDGMDRISTIELSDKVCDSVERLRDTLIHEMCHAACWLIDGALNAGHGPLWTAHAENVARVHPELPAVTRCHTYDINYKYTYECVRCQHSVGRFAALNAKKAFCRVCESGLLILKTTEHDNYPSTSHVSPFTKNYRESHGPARKAAYGNSHPRVSPGFPIKRKFSD
ncbi:germ cell nuclear acidic protein-like [Rhinoderma darwinii]|uniref:germ cell nuclear acidic protein-like n=1 Tax=Rhinoderma darwinii TaxID=43563 RepID=UPI003F681678